MRRPLLRLLTAVIGTSLPSGMSACMSAIREKRTCYAHFELFAC
jgi:hypothetical protein